MFKFHLSRVLAITFSLTTSVIIVLFYVYQSNPFPTIAIAFIVVIGNFFCLVVSLFFYIWQRAHKDTPQKDRLEALETYARLDNDGLLISSAVTIIEIEADSFWRLKEYGETITIPINAMNPLRLPPVGTRATFAPIGNKDNRVIGVITEITNGKMTITPAPTIKPSKPKLTAKTTTSN